ncbi:hypothetical protein NPIL_435721 [Nephila pilipes]|uniref:Uncharacterized protein n=1 Tax=Nephila pilipes TaxID=299642 RepID=A0A8X6UHF3_NEPPI|nr:hypothetical protein NPIL_435721 [Nephila pilipes]
MKSPIVSFCAMADSFLAMKKFIPKSTKDRFSWKTKFDLGHFTRKSIPSYITFCYLGLLGPEVWEHVFKDFHLYMAEDVLLNTLKK